MCIAQAFSLASSPFGQKLKRSAGIAGQAAELTRPTAVCTAEVFELAGHVRPPVKKDGSLPAFKMDCNSNFDYSWA